jgi:hypothetical protein
MALEDGQRSDQSSDDKRQDDSRIQVITRIWQMVIPVMALSIPFFAMSRIGIILPFFAIGAAGIATAVIWGGGTKKLSVDRKENQRLQDRIKELEERLANVETISRFEMQLAAREKAALEDSRAQSTSPSSQAQSSQKESA